MMNTELLKFAMDGLLAGTAPVVSVGETEVSLDKRNTSADPAVFNYEVTAPVDRVTVTARGLGDTLVLRLDAAVSEEAAEFAPFGAVRIGLGGPKPDHILGHFMDNTWWSFPDFADAFSALKPMTQAVLMQYGERFVYLQLLCNGNFSVRIEAGVLYLEPRTGGIRTLSGDFASITEASSVAEIYKIAMENTKALDGMTAILRKDRTYPEIMEKFGWCTWNAFYTDVTEDGIMKKLDEFREKQIPVGWVIIDDGWMSVAERSAPGEPAVKRKSRLAAFEEDRSKFPNGLKACIEKMKKEYGILQVGVWHAFEGYWDGVDPESALAEEWKDCLELTVQGRLIPAHDEEKAFRFYDAWHSYLAECGVDFVKVDNQSSYHGHLEGNRPSPECARIAHAALERSVDKNFNGTIINCMGMDMENVFSRPHTAISRNSDDFFPNVERGFLKHLAQNVYSALWHDELYYCDFDMWWSGRSAPVQSGVLRAVSGSPVYVSDEVGESNRDMIMPVIEDDGTIIRMDQAARPTTDLIFTDCRREDRLMKVWNRSGEAFALAVFNVSLTEVTDSIAWKDIPELKAGRRYVAYEHFSKKFEEISTELTTELTLSVDDTAVYSIYPVENEGDDPYIMMGDPSKYAPIASKNKTRRSVRSLIG